MNALAFTILDELIPDYDRPVTREDIDFARRRLIEKRDVHLRTLAARLRDERIKPVLAPVLSDEPLPALPVDDVRYAVDLGLVTWMSGSTLAIANPIYYEVLIQELQEQIKPMLPALEPVWMTGGRLDPDKLLKAFMDFWVQHGSALMRLEDFPELTPHLVVLAFLQRVVNGGGWACPKGDPYREHPAGDGRMDVFVEHRDLRLAVELKVWRDGREDPLIRGLEQLGSYMQHLRTELGWLILFDRRSGRTGLAERITLEKANTAMGTEVAVLRA